MSGTHMEHMGWTRVFGGSKIHVFFGGEENLLKTSHRVFKGVYKNDAGMTR